jgi:hypothetical protein
MSATVKQSWLGESRFGLVPVGVLGDRRLTLTDLRVFCALATFANKDGKCFPRRERITELTGLDKHQISKATTRLARFGWLTKNRSMHTAKYQLRSTPIVQHEEPGVQPGEPWYPLKASPLQGKPANILAAAFQGEPPGGGNPTGFPGEALSIEYAAHGHTL